MAKGSVYEGKSFEEAVRKGLDSLGLSRAEATITVIEEGKGGFLGFGARPFKVSIMRRPGGAVREPEETRTRRVSSGRDEQRRGGRGGRDRDRGRDDKGGPRKRDENKRDEPRKEEGRRGPQPVRAEGAGAEGGRPEGARAEGGRGGSRREGRGEGREGRGEGREPRGEGREGRGEGRREGRREERRPVVAAESPGPSPVAAGVPTEPRGESDAESLERRRRRRGRRGGRGRRREGAPGVAGEPAQFANGSGADHEALEAESAEAAFEPRAAYEEPREVESAPAPVQSYAAAPAERAEPVRHAETAVAVETYGEPAMATNELADTSRRLTEELLRAMGFEATVTVVADGNRADVTAEIATNDDLLTGQKGEVRQALQHLLNRFLNRGEGSRYHLQLEINDSWRRRELELEALAKSLAEQALSQNAEAVTDYLNSQERRIVHVTLKEDTRVKTFALGTGMVKRVAIAPASFPERTGEEDAG